MRPGAVPLIALGLGLLAYMLTREAVVGLLVTAASFWLLLRKRAPRIVPQPPLTASQPERATGMQVVCKRVTAERQEWVSVKTGRIFEVLAKNGPPDAKPGDLGEVVSSPAGYRIVPRGQVDKIA